jgi:hypothetical protein
MDKLVMTEDFELYSQMKKGDREVFNTLVVKYYLCYVLWQILCVHGRCGRDRSGHNGWLWKTDRFR